MMILLLKNDELRYCSLEAEKEKLEKLWTEADEDGSGALDREEVAEVMKRMVSET